jgi:hypothetical protein
VAQREQAKQNRRDQGQGSLRVGTAAGTGKLPGAIGSKLIQPGTTGLIDERLHEPQQHALIRRVGQVHGNQYVQRAIEQSPASAPSSGVIQRQGGGGPGGGAPGAIGQAQAQKARAKDILVTAFGSVCRIKAPKVVVMNDAAIKQSFVQYQIRQGTKHPRKNRRWESEDAQEINRLDGYADRGADTVYILDQEDDAQIATLVHEMLHANANPGFPGMYKADIDEGATEYLTRVALAKSGVRAPTGGTYGPQVGLITLFVDMIGEGTLIQAYFSNPNALKNMVDTIRGTGTWDLFWMRFMEKDYDGAWELLYPKEGGSWVEHKIKLINGYLDGWVSDDDISMIETICSTLSSEDLKTVRRAISPRIGSLWSHGQRARLRIALGA